MTGAEIYTVYDCPYHKLEEIPAQKRRAGNPRRRGTKYEYKDILCAFDIETTNIQEIKQNVMYIWQFGLEGIGCVIGRTWNEFLYFLSRLQETLRPREKYLIYVHNLSYEFQYLKGIYSFTADDVFAISPRKILKCEMFYCFEFRCSYLQTNMSLDHFTRAMGVQHEKLSGFDYDKVRFFDTELTEEEKAYCVHDVIGLIEAMRKRIEFSDDNFYTVPLTSTGYCRRDAKRCFAKNVPRKIVKDTFPDFEFYSYLRRAFRGGNTHASRFYAGVKLTNVHSVDRSSSYPDVLINHKYPVTRFYEFKDASYKDMVNYIDVRERAVIVDIEFKGLRLKGFYTDGCPYLPIAKCVCSNDRINDNGRIIGASYVRTVLTDIDFNIVRDAYTWDECNILRMYHARYGFLPLSFRDLIKEYFTKKTSLKGVAGAEEDYRHSKELINALYGMSAQDPVKPKLLYMNDDFIEDDSKTGPELLEIYYRTAFLSYAVGVYCTAWARWELQEMIKVAGRGFVYCDTDSVKFVGNADFSEYNARCVSASRRSGAYAADPAGNIHYMGAAEDEGIYQEFKTLGAKKYVSRNAAGKLEITIAGVSKKLGGVELEEAGGVDAFADGFTFYAAGGLEAIYNDDPEISYYERPDGVAVPISSNVYLQPSTYTLGLTAEYRRLLELVYLDIPNM